MAGRKKAEEAAPEKTAGIEENFARLEEIIKKLETGENSLEETFAGYEAGMKLVKSLSSQIDKVEKNSEKNWKREQNRSMSRSKAICRKKRAIRKPFLRL